MTDDIGCKSIMFRGSATGRVVTCGVCDWCRARRVTELEAEVEWLRAERDEAVSDLDALTAKVAGVLGGGFGSILLVSWHESIAAAKKWRKRVKGAEERAHRAVIQRDDARRDRKTAEARVTELEAEVERLQAEVVWTHERLQLLQEHEDSHWTDPETGEARYLIRDSDYDALIARVTELEAALMKIVAEVDNEDYEVRAPILDDIWCIAAGALAPDTDTTEGGK